MLRIGVTGGVGMGKSTSARLLQQCGVPCIDTDELAREVVEPGTEGFREVEAAFGSSIITSEGKLNRRTLARLVFSDAAERRRLEAILHPKIRVRWMTQLRDWERAGEPLGAVIIPLLFETAAAAEFDVLLCVACSPAAQRQRLAARGWNEEESQSRIGAQWPVLQKLAQSDFVVWTEGQIEVHRQQVERILRTLRSGT